MHVPHERETAWRRVDVFIPVWNIVLKFKITCGTFHYALRSDRNRTWLLPCHISHDSSTCPQTAIDVRQQSPLPYLLQTQRRVCLHQFLGSPF